MRIAHFALISMFAFVPFLARADEQPARPQSAQNVAAQSCDNSQHTANADTAGGAACSDGAATDHNLTPSYVEIAIEHVEDAAVPDPMEPSPEQEDHAE